MAIRKAIDYCIENEHLKEFLIGYRAEVESMLLAEGSVEDYIEDMKQEQAKIIQEQKDIIQNLTAKVSELEKKLAEADDQA